MVKQTLTIHRQHHFVGLALDRLNKLPNFSLFSNYGDKIQLMILKMEKILNKERSEAVAQRCSLTGGVLWKGVLKTFVKFTGKHLCQSFFFNKKRPASSLKKRIWHNFFLQNTSGGCLWKRWYFYFLVNKNDSPNKLHCVKSVSIRSYSGTYFPVFELNTEKYGVSFRIQSECGKILTRITPDTDTFHAVLIIVKKTRTDWSNREDLFKNFLLLWFI